MEDNARKDFTRQPTISPDLSFITQVSNLKEAPSADRIIEYQSAIIQQISSLEIDLDSVLKRQEQDFLNAFKYELFKLHSQIKELKKAANNKEIIIKHQEEIEELQKTIEFHKCQTFNLGETYEECKKENLKLKSLNLEHGKEIRKLTESLKKTKKKLKDKNRIHLNEPEKVSILNETSSSQSDSPKKVMIKYIPSTKSGEIVSELLNHHKDLNENLLKDLEIIMERQSKLYEESANHLKSVIKAEKKRNQSNSLISSQIFSQKNDLENLFLECVEEVKREVTKTNVREYITYIIEYLSKEKLPFPKEKEQIFTPGDKRKIIELLVGNEKVLILLYESLFPLRASQFPPRRDRSVRRGKSQEELPPIPSNFTSGG